MMKLPKAIRVGDYDAYVDAMMKKRKFTFITEGAYASVWGRKGCNRIIKLGVFGSDGYMKFVSMVGIKSRCVHFPRIYSIEVFSAVDDDGDRRKYYAVEMERLLEYGSVSSYKSREKYCQSLGIPYIEHMEDPNEMYPTTSHGKRVKKVLKTLFRTHDSDMHDGNIMWRVKGKGHQLVITDPAC